VPPALQVINYFKQSLSGSAFEDLTPGTGDPTTFGTFQSGRAWFADIRGVDDANAAEISIIAPEMHDQIEGIAGWVPKGSDLAPPNRAISISPPGLDEPIVPAESITVRALGTASDNVNVTLVVYYDDLPGISLEARTYESVRASLAHLVGVDVALDASSGAQGDWSTSVSLSAAGRRLNANRKYAVLGFTADVPCAAVGLSAFETGNFRVGGPVLADGDHDAFMIADFARAYNAALIPVISGFNQDSVNLWCADPAASNVALTVMLAELSATA